MAPSDEYERRLRAREASAARLDEQHGRLANLRLLLAGIAIFIAWWSWRSGTLAAWWLLLIPATSFVPIAAYHSRVEERRDRARRAVDFYRRGLARIQDRWSGQGAGGERFSDPDHLYASDLDLFGADGLFALLSRARTKVGEETLASWLLSPASPKTVRVRQGCVAELRELLDLSEDLAVLGSDPKIGVHTDALLSWAKAPNQLTQRWLYWVAWMLPILALATCLVWAVSGLAAPLLWVLLLESLVAGALRRKLREILNGTKYAFEDLNLLAALLVRLEREPFKAPKLRVLVEKLKSYNLSAKSSIRRLDNIHGLVESRHNLILQVLNVPLMYSVHVAFAAERWRSAHGQAVRSWLAVVGEFEALASLAAYSYEHPADPFPEIVDGPASFHGSQLGNPLLSRSKCVRNDVRISEETPVLLISGSNMSGKSTLLRTVGINTVLAMAGAPVRAQWLRLTPLQTGASIRINDSLQKGISRFYAEITRLRQIYDASSRPPPLLFLLDELLQGTNSNDRRIGAQGLVRAFCDRRAIGVISTHDLALTEVELGERGGVRNMHFQDELNDGRITFDFKLHEGILTKSNGIKLMRSIGLKI